jgi:hypothetical protein
MNTLGFLYVNVSNMNYSRKSVLFSNHESRVDFAMTICFTPIFFLLGNMINLRSAHDLSGLGEVEYTYWECIGWNFGIWTVAFILGI